VLVVAAGPIATVVKYRVALVIKAQVLLQIPEVEAVEGPRSMAIQVMVVRVLS
jgi:hypothetical protein